MNDSHLAHAYVDGELSPAERKNFESQMLANPALAREVESIRLLKASVARFTSPVDCGDAWAGCAKRIADLQKVQRTERFVTRNAWSICGAFAFILLASGVWHRMSASGNVENADFAKVMAGNGGFRPQAVSPGRKELNKYLDTMLNEARRVSTDGRIMVVQAAEGELGNHRANRLDLRDGQGEMTLIVTDTIVDVQGLASDSAFPGYGFGLLGQANCIRWNQGGHTFLLAGERSSSDLVETAKSISQPR